MAVMWYWFWMMEAISAVDWFTLLEPPAPKVTLMKSGSPSKGLVDAVHRAGLLGGEYLAGENGLAFSEQLGDFHGAYLLSGVVLFSIFE